MKNFVFFGGLALLTFFSCQQLKTLDLRFEAKPFSLCTDLDLKAVADMRLTHFREYPYLYVGTDQYEEEYLDEYRQKGIDGFLIRAFDGETLAGIVTGCAFSSDIGVTRNAAKKFDELGLSAHQYYYIGEVIINTPYRGKKILPRMLEALGQKILHADKPYKKICFLSVIRENNDPRKPQNYQSRGEEIFTKIGCKKPGVTDKLEWATIVSNPIQNSEQEIVEHVFNDVEFWIHESSQEMLSPKEA